MKNKKEIYTGIFLFNLITVHVIAISLLMSFGLIISTFSLENSVKFESIGALVYIVILTIMTIFINTSSWSRCLKLIDSPSLKGLWIGNILGTILCLIFAYSGYWVLIYLFLMLPVIAAKLLMDIVITFILIPSKKPNRFQINNKIEQKI